jgi:twitching motility protein PilT
MASIDEIFALIKEHGASDLHMTTGAPPMLRVSGEMQPIQYDQLTPELNRRLLYELMSEEQIQKFERDKDIDFSYEIPGVTRLRCNIFEQRKGIAGVFRLISTSICPMEQLGLPKQVLDFATLPAGLVLVTGSTGSGKSTTLASLVDHVNANYRRHIITIEDPIEYIHHNKMSLVNQREVDTNTRSFATALRAALREDPDIIMVGEMRDLDTMQLAITAAETGQLVFGTLHTTGAPQTIDRIIDVFPSSQQSQIRVMLAESLKGVVSQRLLPRKDGRGRAVACEILSVTNAVANMIREHKTYQVPSIMQTGRKDGQQTMDVHLQDLVRRNLISREVATTNATNKGLFQPTAQMVGSEV